MNARVVDKIDVLTARKAQLEEEQAGKTHGGHHRSTYISRAQEDEALVGARPAMVAHYLTDIARLGADARPLPAKPSGATRVATYNINMMCGPNGDACISADDVAALVLSWDADVVVLQEAPTAALDELWGWPDLAAPLEQVRRWQGIVGRQCHTHTPSHFD